MRPHTYLSLLALCLVALSIYPSVMATSTAKRVRMDSIHRLTFYAEAMTKGRRSAPLPQLTCQGEACDWARPDVIFCKSIGAGDWKVSASASEALRCVGCVGRLAYTLNLIVRYTHLGISLPPFLLSYARFQIYLASSAKRTCPPRSGWVG